MSGHRAYVAHLHGRLELPAPREFSWTPELGKRVVGWRPCCTCGWQGGNVVRDRDKGSPRWSADGWPPVFVEGFAEGQWEDHHDQVLEQLGQVAPAVVALAERQLQLVAS